NLALAEVLSEKPATREEGIGFYRAAQACRPQNFAVLLALGNALLEQGWSRQAVDVLRRASQLKPDSAEVLCHLGEALLRLNQLPEGLAEFRRAVQLKPDLAAHWFPRVARLVELDNKLPAVLRGEAQPRNPVERAELAFVCQFHGLYAASARLYGEALVLQPDLATQERLNQLTGAALAISAGTFLFIALSDLLPEVQFHRHDRVPLSLALILGLLLMGGIALLEGHN